MVNFEIKIPDELLALKNLPARYMRARKTVLAPAMDRTVKSVERNVRPLIPEFTGQARRSIVSSTHQTSAATIGRVTSTMRRPNVHIYVLNAGRHPGRKQPPADRLVQWVIGRGLAAASEARKVAYVVARAIRRRGTQGLSFMWRAYDRAQPFVETSLSLAVEQMIKELERDA